MNDPITDADLALLQHREIKTSALASEESLDDVSTAESDAELVTGIRGPVTITTAEPTRNLSPIFSSDSKSPAVVKFSPNMPQGSFISGNSRFQ